MVRHLWAAAVAITSTLTLNLTSASANDLQVTGQLGGGASSVSEDAVGTASLRGRYAWHPTFGVNLALIAGAGADERSIGAVAITADLTRTFGRFRPAVRLGFVHQHETPREDLERSPLTVTLGVDDAIAHRTGGILELGTTIDIVAVPYGVLFGAADVSTQLMFDGNGPRAYMLLGLGLGMRVGL